MSSNPSTSPGSKSKSPSSPGASSSPKGNRVEEGVTMVGRTFGGAPGMRWSVDWGEERVFRPIMLLQDGGPEHRSILGSDCSTSRGWWQ